MHLWFNLNVIWIHLIDWLDWFLDFCNVLHVDNAFSTFSPDVFAISLLRFVLFCGSCLTLVSRLGK